MEHGKALEIGKEQGILRAGGSVWRRMRQKIMVGKGKGTEHTGWMTEYKDFEYKNFEYNPRARTTGRGGYYAEKRTMLRKRWVQGSGCFPG
jgi:hypothetical protein